MLLCSMLDYAKFLLAESASAPGLSCTQGNDACCIPEVALYNV